MNRASLIMQGARGCKIVLARLCKLLRQMLPFQSEKANMPINNLNKHPICVALKQTEKQREELQMLTLPCRRGDAIKLVENVEVVILGYPNRVISIRIKGQNTRIILKSALHKPALKHENNGGMS